MKLVHIFKTLIWLHRTAWWSPRACRSKFWFWVELCCVSCIVSCAHLVCSRSEVCTGVNFRSCHQSETEDSTQGLQNKILKKEKKVEIFLKRSQTVRGLFFVLFFYHVCVCVVADSQGSLSSLLFMLGCLLIPIRSVLKSSPVCRRRKKLKMSNCTDAQGGRETERERESWCAR